MGAVRAADGRRSSASPACRTRATSTSHRSRTGLSALRKKGASPIEIDGEPDSVRRRHPASPAGSCPSCPRCAAWHRLRARRRRPADLQGVLDRRRRAPAAVRRSTTSRSSRRPARERASQLDRAGRLRDRARRPRLAARDRRHRARHRVRGRVRLRLAAVRPSADHGPLRGRRLERRGRPRDPAGQGARHPQGLFHVAYTRGPPGRQRARPSTTIPGVSAGGRCRSPTRRRRASRSAASSRSRRPSRASAAARSRRASRSGPTGRATASRRTARRSPRSRASTRTLTIDYDDGAMTVQGDGRLLARAGLRPAHASARPTAPWTRTGTRRRRRARRTGDRVRRRQVTIQLTPVAAGHGRLRILPNGADRAVRRDRAARRRSTSSRRSRTSGTSSRSGSTSRSSASPSPGSGSGSSRRSAAASTSAPGSGRASCSELGLQVTFNPDQPDETHVEGGAQLAHPGARGPARSSSAAASAPASRSCRRAPGSRSAAGLGLEGAVDAGVHVDWMPTPRAHPRRRRRDLRRAEVPLRRHRLRARRGRPLCVTTIELYSKRWELAALEYGSGLRLGHALPASTTRRASPSTSPGATCSSQIPDVNPREVLDGPVEQIA